MSVAGPIGEGSSLRIASGSKKNGNMDRRSPSISGTGTAMRSASTSNVRPAPLTKASEVRQALARLATQSAALDKALEDNLIQAQESTFTSRQALSGLGRQTDLITDEARVLARRLKETGTTAERISESVRRLDEESERVEKAAIWTEKVGDLKASLLSMAAAIEQRDYGTATQQCIRALSIDEDILQSRFAAIMVPTSEYPDPPPVQLLSMRKMLLQVFTERFQQATEAKDTIEATKFFTMFPQIGWTAEGLAVYAQFARSMVRERGKSIGELLGNSRNNESALRHAQILTHLFENLASLIDQHQPLVDSHYGQGYFAEGVMPELQEECDRLGKRVCDTWYDERYVRRKLEEAKSYNFSYVPSIGTTASSTAAAKRMANVGTRVVSGFNIPGRPGTPSTPQNAAADDAPQVDTREVDKIVGELAAMAASWGTYKHFLTVRLDTKETSTPDVSNGGADDLKDFRRSSLDNRRLSLLPALDPSKRRASQTQQEEEHDKQEKNSPLNVIKKSQLGTKVDELMQNVYVPLESWFLRCSIEKAHRIDTPDLTARPLTTPLLDDVFYLVRLVLARAVSTSNLDILSTMTRNVRYIIDEDFIQAIVRSLDLVSRTNSGSMVVEGPRKDAASREIRSTFGVYLNVLSTSGDYLTRILNELSQEHNLQRQYAEKDVAIASSTIQALSVLVPRIRNIVRTHMDLFFSTLLRARIRQLLSESLRDVSYVLNEDDYAIAEEEASSHGGSSLFVRKLTRGWDQVIHAVGYKDLFTSDNWEVLLRLSIDALVQAWETWSFNVQYSELGALRFDKDVRTVSTFLSSQSATGGLRERFGRLTHISYLVNLDEEVSTNDIDTSIASADQSNVGIGGGNNTRNDDDNIAWRLSAEEVQQIRKRRVGW